ncbi:MAG: hypothetical protein IK134_12115 [Oscillospiraceae bacterium]|nr:hypothetical protein [Oscillospiraceae bacterium]
MQLTQSNKSVLALVFTVLFLITGRLFVWKPDKGSNLQQNNPNGMVAEMNQTSGLMQTTTETTTTTTTTETTTTTTTAFSGFELVPPDYIFTYDPDSGVRYNPDTVPATGGMTTTETTAVTVTTAAETEPPETTTEAPQTTAPAPAAPAGYFNDVLFIGDSRTVGIASYSPIEGATYFATVGLSTYQIDTAVSEVPGTEGQTFAQVLGAKKYGKIYIMLGINEIGMSFDQTMQNMDALIARVQQANPGAKIILMANLHVAAHRHYNDAVVNNTNINNFNALLAAKADNKSVFYLDVNPVFDDANGCLDAQYTSDDTHPYAKYYVTWSEWLQNHVF